MNEFIYRDLESICNNIQLNREEVNRIVEGIEKVIKFTELMLKEGILSLDSLVSEPESLFDKKWFAELHERYGLATLDKKSFDKYPAWLLSLVIDGTEPKCIEKIGLYTYSSSGFNNIDKILYLIYLEGILMLQAGCKLHIIEKMLVSIAPLQAREMYLKKHMPIISKP